MRELPGALVSCHAPVGLKHSRSVSPMGGNAAFSPRQSGGPKRSHSSSPEPPNVWSGHVRKTSALDGLTVQKGALKKCLLLLFFPTSLTSKSPSSCNCLYSARSCAAAALAAAFSDVRSGTWRNCFHCRTPSVSPSIRYSYARSVCGSPRNAANWSCRSTSNVKRSAFSNFFSSSILPASGSKCRNASTLPPLAGVFFPLK
jgi:hypothetical protein